MMRLLCPLALLPGAALAGGFTTVDRSVAAMGQGGTATADGRDPASAAYNPAAGVAHPGLALSAGLVIAAPVLSARGEGWSASTGGPPVTPPMLYARYGAESWAVGASLFVPFGSTVRWPADWPGRFQLVEAQLRVLRAAAFFGMRFGELSVAAGPFVDFGSLALVRSLDFIASEGSTSIDTRGTGVGVQLGLELRVAEGLELGLGYQSRSAIHFQGYADFSVPAELSGRAGDQAISTRLLLPDRLSLGARWALDAELSLMADLELVLWGTVKELRLDFAREETPDVVQPRDWRATLTPRAGLAYRPQALSWLTARAGLFVDPSPVPGATVGPSSPDSTRVGLCAGVGLELPADLHLDLAYQLALLTGAEGSQDELAGVGYAGAIHQLGVGVGWRVSP